MTSGKRCTQRLTFPDDAPALDLVCAECGHLLYIHSPDRDCAGCEAIYPTRAELDRLADKLLPLIELAMRRRGIPRV